MVISGKLWVTGEGVARVPGSSAPMPLTTPRCSPMDSVRTGDRGGPHAEPPALQMGAADGTVRRVGPQNFRRII